jgi:pilus assembly protein CpaF
MMGGDQLPVRTIREMITGSVDVIVQVARLRDGTRKVTHITEVLGMEGDVVTLQDLIVFEISGEDADGNIIGRQRSTGIARPRFWDRATYFGEEHRLAEALASAEVIDKDGNPLGGGNV